MAQDVKLSTLYLERVGDVTEAERTDDNLYTVAPMILCRMSIELGDLDVHLQTVDLLHAIIIFVITCILVSSREKTSHLCVHVFTLVVATTAE